MQLIKEATGLIGLVAVLLALLGHMNSTFATKESYLLSEGRIDANKYKIEALNKKQRKNGSILCGIAIDLKLPTARKECHNIINN